MLAACQAHLLPPDSRTSGPPSPSELVPQPAPTSGIEGADHGWITLDVERGCPERPPAEDPCAQPGASRDTGFSAAWGTLDGREVGAFSDALDGLSEPADFLHADPRLNWLDDSTALITWFDGTDGVLISASIHGPETIEWWRGRDAIESIAVDPTASLVYLSLVDGRTREDRGIWQLAAPGAKATRLADPRPDLLDTAPTDSDPSFAWTRRMWITPDGTRVVAVECISGSCDVRTIDSRVKTEQRIRSGLHAGDIFGVDDAFLYGAFDCGRECIAGVLDLSTGGVRALAQGCGAGPGVVTADAAGNTILVMTTSVPTSRCRRASVLSVISPENPKPIDVFREVGDPLSVPSLVVPTETFSFTVPDASVLIAPGGEAAFDGTSRLLALTDGSTLPVLVEAQGEIQH